MEKRILVGLVVSLAFLSAVPPAFGWDVEKLFRRSVPVDEYPAVFADQGGVLYAVRAIKSDRYYCVGHKGDREEVGGEYWGGKGQCGVQAANDALQAVREAFSSFDCAPLEGSDVAYSFEHNSFFPDVSRPPIVLAKTSEVKCALNPAALPDGVVSVKVAHWKRECVDRGCRIAYWDKARNRVFLGLKAAPGADEPDVAPGD